MSDALECVNATESHFQVWDRLAVLIGSLASELIDGLGEAICDLCFSVYI
jgi:hypothetical protein